jgi:hypothetical protein
MRKHNVLNYYRERFRVTNSHRPDPWIIAGFFSRIFGTKPVPIELGISEMLLKIGNKLKCLTNIL